MASHSRPGQQECEFHLAEEVSLLLPRGKAGQVAADHQVRVVQDRVEPTPGGQQSLDVQGKRVTVSEPNKKPVEHLNMWCPKKIDYFFGTYWGNKMSPGSLTPARTVATSALPVHLHKRTEVKH